DLEDIRHWCAVAARASDAKKGEDTVILEVGGILAITDAFVIASGSNPRQVRTIAEEVEAKVKEGGGPSALRIEGLDDARRALMVDTLFDLKLTGEMLDTMRRQVRAAANIGTVVNTHANGDHCWGNELVAGAAIVASRACAEEMPETPPSVLAGMLAAAPDM